MENQPRSRARLAVSIILVVLIAASLIAAAHLRTNSSSASTRASTTTSQSTATQSQTYYSAVSPSGLQLLVRLNAIAMQQGSPPRVQVSLVNTLATNVSLAPNYSANPNIANWDNYDTLCGLSQVDNTFGFALFQGNYAAGNFTQAGTPMLLTPPVATTCPNRFYDQAYVQDVQFAPESDVATLSANSSFSSDFKPQTINMQENATTGTCSTLPYNASGTTVENGVTTTSSGTYLGWGCGSKGGNSLTGYWTQPSNGNYLEINDTSNSTIIGGLSSAYRDYYHQLPPGPYTVVAEDMWNQTAYAHLEVTPAGVSPVEVVSVLGPIPPFNPGGPTVNVTLRNTGIAPITSLNATLSFVNPSGVSTPHLFVFGAAPSNPFWPSETIQATSTLIGASLDSSLEYPLTIKGTFVNGTQFSSAYEVNVLPTSSTVQASSTSSPVIIQSTVACPSNTTCGSMTRASAGQVQVESVQATQFVCQNCGAVNGQSYVRFAVIFENAGNSPIYIPDGSVGVSISVPPDSILQKVASGLCAGTFAIAKLNPGQNYTLYGPDCFTGYDYQLVQAGSVNVTFSFNWTTNSKASTNPTDFTNSTTISAQFVFA